MTPHYVVVWERSAVVEADSESQVIEAMESHLAKLGVDAQNVQVHMTTSWPADLNAAEELA